MIGTDSGLEADRMEQANLEGMIASMEKVSLAPPDGTNILLKRFLDSAKARLGFLEKKIREAEREKEQTANNQMALTSLAQSETGLSAAEKEQYSGFLKEEFFTKRDFHRLDEFYAHAWDRLSERGKGEMSHRIWEGVRRNEFKFTDLPKDVQEKEELRVNRLLSLPGNQIEDVSKIPERDRKDFLSAYQSGNRQAAGEVLNRDSFKSSLFRSDDSAPVIHAAVQFDAGAVLSSAETSARAPQTASAKAAKSSKAPTSNTGADANDQSKNLDISGVDVSSLALADGNVQTPAANVLNGFSVRSR